MTRIYNVINWEALEPLFNSNNPQCEVDHRVHVSLLIHLLHNLKYRTPLSQTWQQGDVFREGRTSPGLLNFRQLHETNTTLMQTFNWKDSSLVEAECQCFKFTYPTSLWKADYTDEDVSWVRKCLSTWSWHTAGDDKCTRRSLSCRLICVSRALSVTEMAEWFLLGFIYFFQNGLSVISQRRI